jgi:hypothetical protein
MEDGSLKAIGRDAEKAAQGTDKATKSADKYSKKNKGVAQATSNSTKAFSKMTTGIQGGLVPAYATLNSSVRYLIQNGRCSKTRRRFGVYR